MLTKNRITLLFPAFLLISIAVISSGQTSRPANGTRMKVLRKKDQLHIKPDAAEIASYQNKFQEESPATKKEERELDDQIPKHLPIRIKITKEKEEAFKDLKNEKWLREFALEVRNVGDKPIYFLSLIFSMPEIKAPDGNEYGFSLHYGRGDLLDFLTPLRPEDTPLNPGETYVFRIRENMLKGWEGYSSAENKAKLQPKKVIIRFNLLNFGDKTGFMGTSGIPIPNNPEPKGNTVRYNPNSNKTDPAILDLDTDLNLVVRTRISCKNAH